jgi:hypothetical protein
VFFGAASAVFALGMHIHFIQAKETATGDWRGVEKRKKASG